MHTRSASTSGFRNPDLLLQGRRPYFWADCFYICKMLPKLLLIKPQRKIFQVNYGFRSITSSCFVPNFNAKLSHIRIQPCNSKLTIVFNFALPPKNTENLKRFCFVQQASKSCVLFFGRKILS